MMKMKVLLITLGLVLVLGACSHETFRQPSGNSDYQISFPILTSLQKNGWTPSADTIKWMKNWQGIDLEQTNVYSLPKLSGSSSVNLKIRKVDATDSSASKAMGIFLAPNSSGNPPAELAYFNMAAVLGWDSIVRPAARYELGPKASQEFLALIQAGPISADQRNNADNIIKLINAGPPLQGCLKAEKDKTAGDVDSMCDPKLGTNGGPNFTSPVIASLQTSNSAPVHGTSLEVIPGYTGDAFQLALEYSVVMTLDAIFQQDDRYSGGNIGIRKDAFGQAHFYASDNGGAYLQDDSSKVTTNLSWFSRYDRNSINELRKIDDFLAHPGKEYLGYTDPVKFVTDLGFYFETDPAVSKTRLQRNIEMLLNRVDSFKTATGNPAYLN
jgi:hypothetical protein